MKTFRLSSRSERISSILLGSVVLAGEVAMLYALRNDLTIFIMAAVFCLLLSAAMVYSIITTIKASCTYEAEGKKLHVTGARKYTLDLSNATMLQTIGVKNGHTMSRILVFSDAEDNIIASVPTVFTSKQGVWAEPMAIELAQEMGLEFKANVEPWHYDEEKRKEHEKEVALQEKEEAKQRKIDRAKKMRYRIEKRRKQMGYDKK